jgi:arsenate reductase
MGGVTGIRKHRVLFVCLGNACRSQMAEGFARTYGADVVEAHSAGISPALSVPTVTREVMGDRNIDITEQAPKGIYEVDLTKFDLVINMSGYPFPEPMNGRLREWSVPDPVGESKKYHEQVAQLVERLVVQLLMELRVRAPLAGAACLTGGLSLLH